MADLRNFARSRDHIVKKVCNDFHIYDKSGYKIVFDDESLLLYKKKSGQVYGFEKEAAALLLAVEETVENGKDVFASFPAVDKEKLTEIVELLVTDV